MNTLLKILGKLYGTEAERVNEQINFSIVQSSTFKHQNINNDWYKLMACYFIYPNGVIYDKKISPLKNIIYHIPHIKDLGCNALHILPFLKSPMIDKGFDISNFYTIREDLGTEDDLHELIRICKMANINLFMDLVLNHVSEQHEWFQKAQLGESKYQKYFITSYEKPLLLRKFHMNSAVWAEYQVSSAKKIVNIAFPEQVGQIPHWRLGKDHIWYYHTFYPQQPDLNWLNPDIFIEISNVMLHWCALGFNFRLDAIPFVGEGAYKLGLDKSKTHLILAALKLICYEINPCCAFIVETFEDLETVMNYFGPTTQIQANLSYNFHLCTNLWVSLIKQKNHFIWKVLEAEKNIPQHAEWLNFLRNHDELSLAHLEEKLIVDIRNSILKHGMAFREGYGISGRTFSLLGANRKHYYMAYFLLASLPGSILIAYGDDIALKNVAYKKLSVQDKLDTRNINRGTILVNRFISSYAKKTINQLKMILHNRKNFKELLLSAPHQISTSPDIFAIKYTNKHQELVIYVNLTNELKCIELDCKDIKIEMWVNYVKLKKKTITLGGFGGIWLSRVYSCTML